MSGCHRESQKNEPCARHARCMQRMSSRCTVFTARAKLTWPKLLKYASSFSAVVPQLSPPQKILLSCRGCEAPAPPPRLSPMFCLENPPSPRSSPPPKLPPSNYSRPARAHVGTKTWKWSRSWESSPCHHVKRPKTLILRNISRERAPFEAATTCSHVLNVQLAQVASAADLGLVQASNLVAIAAFGVAPVPGFLAGRKFDAIVEPGSAEQINCGSTSDRSVIGSAGPY